MKKAILFGASGFVGSYLLTELLRNLDYSQVTVVVRKKLPIDHPKLKTLIGDYHSLSDLKDEIEADDVFIALGTTKKATPDPVKYYEVDHDYPVLAAKLAKEKGATAVYLVTAVGADANSKFSYVKTKGECERDIIKLNYPHTNIFQPSMILGERKEHRALESAFVGIWSVINPMLIGSLSRHRGTSAKDIARAMNQAAKRPTDKVKIYRWAEMRQLVITQ